jgi:hypothetical protein
MPSFFRQFYVNDQYLGSSEDHIRFIHGEAQHPVPYVMFCPCCGELWARMPVVNSMADWRIIGGYCERHGKSRYAIAGSLMLQWEPELTAILPDGVIQREFELHLRLWDKENVRELERT